MSEKSRDRARLFNNAFGTMPYGGIADLRKLDERMSADEMDVVILNNLEKLGNVTRSYAHESDARLKQIQVHNQIFRSLKLLKTIIEDC